MNEMLEIARRRYTTKHYDPSRRISDQDFHDLMEIVRLSPSSVNSQPWHWFVAADAAAKEKILPAILDFNRPRVTDASHVVVFTVRDHLDDAYLTALQAQEVADGRFTKVEAAAGSDAGRRHFVGLHQVSHAEQLQWETHQVYIAMGILTYAAAGMGIDSTFLEGMNMHKCDEILGLPQKGFRTVCAVSLGYRLPDDSNLSRPKSRWPLDAVMTML